MDYSRLSKFRTVAMRSWALISGGKDNLCVEEIGRYKSDSVPSRSQVGLGSKYPL